LGGITEVEAIVGVIAYITPIGVSVRASNGGFARGRSPNGFVASFGDFGQALVHFIPTGLEILDDDLRLARTREDR